MQGRIPPVAVFGIIQIGMPLFGVEIASNVNKTAKDSSTAERCDSSLTLLV
jgi:hypothetical protein